MKLTGAAILVSRGMKVLQAAPAAYPYRYAASLTMERLCSYCGTPAVPGKPDPPWCARCWEWYAEDQKRWVEVQQSGGIWNASQDDPWCRNWLISRDLFETYRQLAPKYGQKIHATLGGDVFEFGRESSCWVQVWVARREVVVAYGDAASNFEHWVEQVRHSAPLELGQVREGSSYGAYVIPGHRLPVVKWAQTGDWAGLARGWFIGSGRRLVPDK